MRRVLKVIDATTLHSDPRPTRTPAQTACDRSLTPVYSWVNVTARGKRGPLPLLAGTISRRNDESRDRGSFLVRRVLVTADPPPFFFERFMEIECAKSDENSFRHHRQKPLDHSQSAARAIAGPKAALRRPRSGRSTPARLGLRPYLSPATCRRLLAVRASCDSPYRLRTARRRQALRPC